MEEATDKTQLFMAVDIEVLKQSDTISFAVRAVGRLMQVP